MQFSVKFVDIASHFGHVYRTGVCTDSRSDYPITGSQLILIYKYIHQMFDSNSPSRFSMSPPVMRLFEQ